MKIVTDTSKLKKRVLAKSMTQKDVDEISQILKEEVERHGGIGLSANQLGLDIRACIINVKDPLVLINPVIKDSSKDTIAYVEQCLSLPKTMKKPVKTVRAKSITITTDNLGVIEFGPDGVKGEDGREWKSSEEFFGDEGLLECVCAQHEIDHLDGVLITHSSRRYNPQVTVQKKYGRNERVMVKLPDGSTDFMKYKKAVQMLQYGCEIL